MTIIETRGVAAPHRVPCRSHQQPAEDHPHHRAIADHDRDQVHDPLAGARRLLGLRRGPVQAARRGLCLVQSAPDAARGLVRPGVHQRCGDQSRLGKMAAAQSDQRPLVRRDTAAALSRRACGQRSRPRPEPHGARVHRRISRALRDRRPAQGARRSRLLASVAGCSSSASIRSTAPASPSCWRRCASTASRSPPSISASSAPSISSSGSWPQAATPTPSSINSRKGMTSEGIPYVVEFAFGLHQSGLTQGGSHVPQVRHRRQLERRDQQSVPRFRIHRRRAGEHAWPRCAPTPASR